MSIALITGASRGIGRAIAEKFASEGYNLILTGNDSYDTLKDFSSELKDRYNISIYTYKVNFESMKDIKKMFDSIHSMIPNIDIDVLVNNVGTASYGLFTEATTEEYQRVMNVNLTSAIVCSKEVLPYMISAKSGKIINITSVWGEVGASMEVIYSTSKAGLIGFTKSLAKELAPSNIQVNAISCGLIDTDMNKNFTKRELNAVIRDIPSDRMGTAEEVADLALQLTISNSYLTGQVIRLDGGWI